MAKGTRKEKTHDFKNIYEDDIMEIEEEVEHIKNIDKTSKASDKKIEIPESIELVSNIILVELQEENSSLCN